MAKLRNELETLHTTAMAQLRNELETLPTTAMAQPRNELATSHTRAMAQLVRQLVRALSATDYLIDVQAHLKRALAKLEFLRQSRGAKSFY